MRENRIHTKLSYKVISGASHSDENTEMPHRENLTGGTERQRAEAELSRAGSRLRADGEIHHPAQGSAQLTQQLQGDVCPSG